MSEEQIAIKKALEGAYEILCPVQFSIQRIDDKKSIDALFALVAACADFEKRVGGTND